ncbi:MAG: M48 family metallopeptidase [Candidatus Accumulibacter sp.]|jgi:STE24 endopeptidase|nr:M48 family metallopeptidase [Accumulibacter sp.]
MPALFSVIFLCAFFLKISLRLWLAWRQIRHVAAHRAEVPEAFAGRIRLASHQRAADYCIARTKLGAIGLFIDAALLLALTYGGGLQAMHEFLSACLDGAFYSVALVALVALVSELVDLPLALYAQFVVEQKFGFNRMSLKLFFVDLAKQTVVGALIGVPVLLVAIHFIETRSAAWWVYTWLFWCAFNVLILFLYPLWIAPLFNTFAPLEDAPLKARIEALLDRCGFAASGLFVMDGSKRSAHGNAYFTGFGKTKRIVFFDTLLKRLDASGVEAVLAHELGHFKYKHVVKRIALLFAVSLAFFALFGRLIDAEWFYRGLGVEASGAALALILFFLTLPVFIFPLSPLMNFASRRDEFEADRYATEHSEEGALADALVRIYDDNASTLTPDPLHSLFYDSHPPAYIRIRRLAGCAGPAGRTN